MTAVPGKKSKFERFHGAFTGGFSAGYFNTVGSENNAGFQPSTFVSSRSNRASVDLVTSRKEHYMDDEDGLLGGHLSTKQDTDSFNKKGSAFTTESDSRIIPGPLPSDLIIVPVDSVGKKLLASMGWKQGHGVGPMQRRRISDFSETELATIPKSSMQNGFVLFPAPRDSEGIKLEMPTPKTDLVGLGYDIANENPEMLDFIRSKNRTTKHKGGDTMQGNTYRVDDLFNKRSSKSSSQLEGAKYSSGFAYDEDVDEVYEGVPDRGSYLNHELTEEDVLEQVDRKESSLLRGVNAWLGETTEGDAKLQQRSYDGRNPLPGFHVSKDEKIVPPIIDRIEVPANFTGKHVFPAESMGAQVDSSGLLRRKKIEGGLAVVAARATILNNSGVEVDAKSGSIFDMLSVDDQQRIKNITQTGKESATSIEQLSTSVSVDVVQSSSIAPVIPATVAERPMLTSASLLNSTFAGLSQAFRNRFVTSTGSSSLPENIVKEGMATAAEYTAKISATIASSSESKKENYHAVSAKQTAKPKTFHVVRNTTIWAPAPLLCKRFNIKTPEISKDFAAINAKQDDGGIFDRLFPGSEAPAVVEKSDEAKDTKAVVDEELLQQFEKQDVYMPVTEKPPVSLFKSIFLDDSDSESDSEVDNAAMEEVAAPVIDRNQADSFISEKVPIEKKEFIAPDRIVMDNRIPEIVSSVDSIAVPSTDRDEAITPYIQPAKVAFVSKKDRLQNGSANTKGSGNLTFGSASFRPGKQKKSLLMSDEPQDENKEEVNNSFQKEIESKTSIEDDRDEVSMKRRKHQLNSKRKTPTLSFDSGEEEHTDDLIPIIRKKTEAKPSASEKEAPKPTEAPSNLDSVGPAATKSTIGNITAVTDRQAKPFSTRTSDSSSSSSSMEDKVQRRKNEAQANQFLAALLSKHTVHGDPDLDVPLPSYLTDAPPRPAGPRVDRSIDSYPSSSSQSNNHSSNNRRRDQNGSSSMSNSYQPRPPAFPPPPPPPLPSRGDNFDDTEEDRKAPSFAALSQRLKAELDDKSRRKEEKKKHNKEKKDKKDKKDKKKRSGSDSD